MEASCHRAWPHMGSWHRYRQYWFSVGSIHTERLVHVLFVHNRLRSSHLVDYCLLRHDIQSGQGQCHNGKQTRQKRHENSEDDSHYNWAFSALLVAIFCAQHNLLQLFKLVWQNPRLFNHYFQGHALLKFDDEFLRVCCPKSWLPTLVQCTDSVENAPSEKWHVYQLSITSEDLLQSK